MKRTIKYFMIFILTLGFTSCATDDNNLNEDLNNSVNEDLASVYVGKWSYFDKRLGKNATDVTIEKISNDKIRVIGFHNLGANISTKFKVYGNFLEIISSKIDGLSIKGKGTSNYSRDEIHVLYSVDGYNFEATMIKK